MRWAQKENDNKLARGKGQGKPDSRQNQATVAGQPGQVKSGKRD